MEKKLPPLENEALWLANRIAEMLEDEPEITVGGPLDRRRIEVHTPHGMLTVRIEVSE